MQTAVANVQAKTKYVFTQKVTILLLRVQEEWVISEQKNRGVAKMVARNISSALLKKKNMYNQIQSSRIVDQNNSKFWSTTQEQLVLLKLWCHLWVSQEICFRMPIFFFFFSKSVDNFGDNTENIFIN